MNTLTQTILDTVPVGALATVNRDRTPLVTPLHFVRVGMRLPGCRIKRHVTHTTPFALGGQSLWCGMMPSRPSTSTPRCAKPARTRSRPSPRHIRLSWEIFARSVPSRSGMSHRLASWMIIPQQKIGCITLRKTLYIAYNRHYN